MPRADLDIHFNRIEQLVIEMNSFVPVGSIKASDFRADLAGLLVVTIAASYESCVKETLVSFASRQHNIFGIFAAKNYEKLNSKISIDDLRRYCDHHGDEVANNFKKAHSRRKKRLEERIGKNIDSAYKLILSWRHAFAHAGQRNTTIEEALATHRLAKRVLYAFDEAFNC